MIGHVISWQKARPVSRAGFFMPCIYPTCLRRVWLQLGHGIFAADERAACASRQEAHESLVVEMECLALRVSDQSGISRSFGADQGQRQAYFVGILLLVYMLIYATVKERDLW